MTELENECDNFGCKNKADVCDECHRKALAEQAREIKEELEKTPNILQGWDVSGWKIFWKKFLGEAK